MVETNAKGRLPRWARRVLIIASIAGPICGVITTVAITVIDIRAKVRTANDGVDSSYKTLAPAVSENQRILTEVQTRAEDTDAELRALKEIRAKHEARIVRLEAYVDILSLRRNLPSAPPVSDERDPIAHPPISVKKPVRPVPTNLQAAKAYQHNRLELKCNPSDPLCGK